MWTLYCNSKTKNLIFDIENVNEIRKLFMGYIYVQSLQVIKVLPNLRIQIVQQNLPYAIERLQCFFVESFCTAILAVFDLSRSLGDNPLETYETFFFKKNSKRAGRVKQNFLEKTTQFRLKLLQKCNLKAVQKGCREKKIRATWFLHKNVGVRRS